MNRSAKAYIAAVCAVGVTAAVACTYQFLRDMAGRPFGAYGWRILFLVGLCAVCRSVPILIRKDQQLDLSIIGMLASFLLYGTSATVFVYIVSSFFTFERDGNKIRSIYTISPVKTLFNMSDIILSIVIPGLCCRLLHWQPGDFTFPMVLLPTLVFSVLAFVCNYAMLLCMFCLNGDMTVQEMGKSLSGLTLNVLAAMPLGLTIGLVLSLPMGSWLGLLMVCPLLLARYAWKLYLDATRHKEALITAFITAMEARDPYTQGHSKRVCEYAEKLARQLCLSARDQELVHSGALLHDIGKIGVSDLILHKPGALTSEEWQAMKRHPAIGLEIVKQVGLEDAVLEMILSHHERYDGAGYPDGKLPEELCLSTRILTVADAYDAMTSDRPYRKGMSVAQALGELARGAGTQFDPDVVSAMLSLTKAEEQAV